MKIALLSSGFSNQKTLDYFENNKELLIDVLNPDIYFSSYNDAFVKQAAQSYRMKKLDIENIKDIPNFESHESKVQKKHASTNFSNTMHMWRKRKRVFDIVEKSYDIYIFSRLDIRFERKFDLSILNRNLLNAILVPEGGDYENGLNDLFVIGNYDSIKIYCSLFDYILDYCNEGCNFHPEKLLRYHIEKFGLQIERFPFRMWINTGWYN